MVNVEDYGDLASQSCHQNLFAIDNGTYTMSHSENFYRSCVIQRSKIKYRFQHLLTLIHHYLTVIHASFWKVDCTKKYHSSQDLDHQSKHPHL